MNTRCGLFQAWNPDRPLSAGFNDIGAYVLAFGVRYKF